MKKSVKNNWAFQILIVAAVALVGTLVLKNKKPAPLEKLKEVSVDFSDPSAKSAAVANSVRVGATNPTAQKVLTVDLQRCAPFLSGGESLQLEDIYQQIKSSMQFQNEVLEMTEYELRSDKNEDLVIQDNSYEEKKDQIRVFKIAQDGLPDRIKDFPNATLSKDLRLEGALTLGRLTKKTEKYQALSASGANLFYESAAGKIIRLSLTTGRNQLQCEEQVCSCNQY